MQLETDIADETPVSTLSGLATICNQADPARNVTTLSELARVLAEIVNQPVAKIDFLDHKGNPIPDSRKVPNILCGHSGCTVRVERTNGLHTILGFPTTVGQIDHELSYLGRRQTTDEARLAEFETALRDTLDAYGHLTWTVGNEDWIACADAALGIFEGRRFLAWHVVVDCESGGFTDTLETGFVEITPDGNPPIGILSQWIDVAFENYAHEQDGGADPDQEHLQIDTDECLRTSKEFDDTIREIWNGEGCPEVTWPDDEQQDDPVADGWVGSDGRP